MLKRFTYGLMALALMAAAASAQTVPPVLDPIGPQSVNEGSTLSFRVSASDGDVTIPSLLATPAVANALFVDSGNGAGSYTFTPDFTQAGVINVTFAAIDPVTPDTTREIVAITVNDVNQEPVLAAIGPQSVNEGQTLAFTVTATDADGSTPVLSTSTLPPNASFVPATGAFSFTPDFTQAGTINVTFYATDALVPAAVDSEQVVITVTNVNQDPVLNPIGPQSVNEGQNLAFTVTASDADGTTPTLSTSTLPANASFVPATGAFSFTPDFTQAGSFNITFRATDGLATDSEIVVITVTNVNQDPILNPIGPQSVNEGQNLAFTVTASDPDGTTPTLSTSTLPANASFVPATGAFSFTPDFTQAGSFNITFRATDGLATDSEVVVVTVTNVNQDPILNPIGPQSVNEAQNLAFTVTASDPDGTTPTLSTSTLPANASFVPATGAFSFTPDFTQAGSFNVTFRATDGLATDSEIVVITVTNVNQDPILNPIGPRSVNEGQNLAFTVTASDPDGTTPTLSTSTLPANASFVPATGAFSFTPDFTQAGSFNITFRATDGIATDSEIVVITVTNVNQDPILNPIGPRSVNEGQNLAFTVTASDADGTTPTLSTSTLPANASFVPATGAFSFTPDFTQAGSFNVTFRATDGLATDSEVVVITVTNVNRDPILAAIGNRAVTEGQNLSFTVSASDPDGPVPVLSSSTLPANAAFTPATGAFSFNPSFTQAGSYQITFYATDAGFPTAIDSELVTITVNEAGNQAPVLAAIGNKVVTEGQTLSFGVSATDPDGTFPTMSTGTLPPNATFTPAANGTGSFVFTPDFTQSGLVSVTFYANDGLAVDSELIQIVIGESGNQAPILNPIGPQSVTEGLTLNFTVTATDPDATTPVLSSSTLPPNASFTPATGAFTFSPSFTQAGVFNVTFYAFDGILRDSEVVAITVIEAGNQTPVLATIGPRSVTEGQNLAFTVTATDPDGTTPTLSTSALPPNASFTPATGAFSFTPDFTQAGSFNITFRAGDGLAVDSEVVVITVNEAGNQTPVLATIGPRTVSEGSTLNFTVTATDPDGTTPTLSTSTLPPNASFTPATGAFSFSPNFTQSGIYNVTFRASDGLAVDSEVVQITVTEGGNQAPVLATIGPRSVTENQLLSFTVSATDADGSTPSITTSTLPPNAAITSTGTGTETFTFTPSFAQQGVYNVTFYASDGLAVDSEVVAITVNDAGNQAPVLATVGNRSVTEGQLLSFTVSATDPDATLPTITTSTLPPNASITSTGAGTETFSFTPSFTQAGVVNITFYASDGLVVDSEAIQIIIIEAGNQTPVLAAIGNRTVAEGANLTFVVSATDPDGTIPVLQTTTLPPNATFTNPGTGSGTLSFDPDFTQAGVYSITFRATDGVAVDSEVVSITVTESGNQFPVLATIGPRSTTEGVNLTFAVTATDPDGPAPLLSTTALPAGATFTGTGPGAGSFNFTPGFTQAGAYNVTFYATDASVPSAVDSEQVVITVNEAGNQTPLLAAIGPRSVTEGLLLSFTITATDPDGTTPTFGTSTLPPNAALTNTGSGTETFTFTPDFTQAGTFNITFFASDGTAADSELVVITVNEAGNQLPVLATIGPRGTTEGVNLSFAVNATDVDGAAPLLSTSTLPVNATFTPTGPGAGSFSFTPDFTQAGTYNVTFYATDASVPTAVDSEQVVITVSETNLEPVLAAIGPQSVTEGQLLTVNISASDADGPIPQLSTSTLPANALFTDNLNGTGVLSFTPGFTQAGVYNVTFYARDAVITTAVDSEIVQITVLDAGNQAPILAAIGNRTTAEGVLLTFSVSATDADGTTPTITASTLPLNATLTSSGTGTETFSFTPGFTQSGVYNVTFYASDGLAVDSELVQITVVDQGNIPPTLVAVADTSINEGTSLVINVSATDPDGVIPPSLSVVTTLLNYSFVDNGNGTGTLTYNSTYFDAGVDTVRFFALDFGSPRQSGVEIMQVTTVDVNRAPVLLTAGPYTVTVGQTLNFFVVATDSTSPSPNPTVFLSAIGAPANSQFTDLGNRTGSFQFTPTAAQLGLDTVTFLAVDNGTPPLSVTADVRISVVQVNQPPVLAPIGPKVITEGQPLIFNLSATDPDGAAPSILAVNLPAGATISPTGPGTAQFSWTPNFTQGGNILRSLLYNIEFRASDGEAIDKEVVLIQVRDAGNQIPVFDSLPSASVVEGQPLVVRIRASDPDGGAVTLQAINATLPLLARFADSTGGLGTITWTPGFTTAGLYQVSIIVNDGVLRDTGICAITVIEAGNQSPIWTPIADTVRVTETIALTFSVTASDPDGVPVLSAAPLPSGAIFTDSTTGTGGFVWVPDNFQAGTYPIIFYADDNLFPGTVDTEQVIIVVRDTNLAPNPPTTTGGRTMFERDTLRYLVTASDPDGTFPRLRAVLDTRDTLATNMTFFDSLNGRGVLTFVPDYTQGGTPSSPLRLYSVRFYARDEINPALETPATVAVQITVQHRNAPPVLEFPDGTGPFVISEGQNVSFNIIATDIDGTVPTITTGPLPAGAVYTQFTSNFGAFSWVPDLTQSGNYSVRFFAADAGGLRDTQDVTIVVADAGAQPATVNSVIDDTLNVLVERPIEIPIRVSAPPGAQVVLDARPIYAGANFVDSGNGVGVYRYVPPTAEVGTVKRLGFYISGPNVMPDSVITNFRVVNFMRGDVDGNNRYSMNDLVALVGYLYRGGTPPAIPEMADSNGDGSVNLLDVAHLVNFLYFGGPQPAQ